MEHLIDESKFPKFGVQLTLLSVQVKYKTTYCTRSSIKSSWVMNRQRVRSKIPNQCSIIAVLTVAVSILFTGKHLAT